ncbi:energy transducer TonB [Ottowia testudinis]|uniref:Energy transducer TonB n=1 Tax=Ottowia testudinis TaxID=2816950 RepID=A0A975H2M2_9BURK|nr:energy transducer TonB [Ottowia testudinis]QTD44340.1 energy transducer TonB [Ottowia testudinis]
MYSMRDIQLSFFAANLRRASVASVALHATMLLGAWQFLALYQAFAVSRSMDAVAAAPLELAQISWVPTLETLPAETAPPPEKALAAPLRSQADVRPLRPQVPAPVQSKRAPAAHSEPLPAPRAVPMLSQSEKAPDANHENAVQGEAISEPAPIQASVPTTVDPDPQSVATNALPHPPLRKAQPDYAYNPAPDYPRLLRDQGVGGVVWLRVWVQTDGQPGDITLVKGSGYRLLDESALRAVRHWRFLPARQGEQSLASWVEFPIRFAISG